MKKKKIIEMILVIGISLLISGISIFIDYFIDYYKYSKNDIPTPEPIPTPIPDPTPAPEPEVNPTPEPTPEEDPITDPEPEEEPVYEDNHINCSSFEKDNVECFKKYLEPFTNSCEGKIFISKNTENFTNKDISYFVSAYFGRNAYKEQEPYTNLDSYNISIDRVDEAVFKYFNVKDYELETTLAIEGYEDEPCVKITKKDGYYKFEYLGILCNDYPYLYENPVLIDTDEFIKVRYEINFFHGDGDIEFTGKYSTFYLKYNNGNYNIIKIEE